MIEKSKTATSYRFSEERDGKEVGYASLYIMTNDTHEEPYGYFADLVVDLGYRRDGIGTELTNAVIAKAKELGCYKLIGTSREKRPKVHEMYENIGFTKYGFSFRMDF